MSKWSIARIEALRWRLLRRLCEKIEPAHDAAVAAIRDMGGAYHLDWTTNRLTKLTPVRPGGTRLGWSVRKLSEQRPKEKDHGLAQLATIALPEQEKLEAGANYMLIVGWKKLYLRCLAGVNLRLYRAIIDDYLPSQQRSCRVLRINGRIYPINRTWVSIREEAHDWWPHFKEQRDSPFGVVDV